MGVPVADQLRDKARADALFAKVEVEQLIAGQSYASEVAYRIDHNLNHPYDTGPDYDKHVKEYDRLEVLLFHMGLYKAAVIPGWKGGIGQPNHETYEGLVARLKGLYPEVDAVVQPAQ